MDKETTRPREAGSPLSQGRIKDLLRTETIGRELRLLGETGSTNSDLARAAAEGAPDGTVIHAETQRTGHGRQGRGWASPRGTGLYLSILFRPDLEPCQASTFPLMVGCAIAEAVQPFLGEKRAMLKWPNDILVEGRKLCGILCEMKMREGCAKVDHVIAGIGLNVNLRLSDLDPETAKIATSLSIATGETFEREEVFVAILQAIERAYRLWLADGFGPFPARIAERDALAGRPISVDRGDGHVISGVADGLFPDGSLRLRLPDGTVEPVYSGDAHILRS